MTDLLNTCQLLIVVRLKHLSFQMTDLLNTSASDSASEKIKTCEKGWGAPVGGAGPWLAVVTPGL